MYIVIKYREMNQPVSVKTWAGLAVKIPANTALIMGSASRTRCFS